MMREQYGAATKELQTVNNELKLKFDMVSRAHRDLQNLIRATAVGTMFLDTSLRIKRFTPRVADLVNIQGSDEGRPVADFTHRLDYPDLVNDARRVLTDLIPSRTRSRTRWRLCRPSPNRR